MKVINFNSKDLEDHLQHNFTDFAIETDTVLVLGIREGGMPLAEIVKHFFEQNNRQVDLHSITCQRPSTKTKKGNTFKKSILKSIFKITPQFILNFVRVLEHKNLMNNKNNSARKIIINEPIDFNKYSKILIVDDAVDSGNTLKEVHDFVKNHISDTTNLKSMSVVVTSKETCTWPDYYLYSDVLIRFPWSLDG